MDLTSKSRRSSVMLALLIRTMRLLQELTTPRDTWRIQQVLAAEGLRTRVSTTLTMRNKKMFLQPKTRLRPVPAAIVLPRNLMKPAQSSNLKSFNNSKKWKRPWMKSDMNARKYRELRRSWSRKKRRSCRIALTKWKPRSDEKWTEKGSWRSRRIMSRVSRNSSNR